MKKSLSLIMFISLFLFSCAKAKEPLPGNDTSMFKETEGDKLIVKTVSAPKSDITGQLEAFARYEKQVDEFSVTFNESITRTHQLIFEFDALYPVQTMIIHTDDLKEVSIEYSLDKTKFTKYINNQTLSKGKTTISLDGVLAYAIRLVFPDDKKYTIDDIYFTLAPGMMVKERHDWFDAFYQRKGWTGADGIFSFNLDGSTHLDNDSQKLFIFSDTFVGELYEEADYRKTMIMINNSIGYHDPSKPLQESMRFKYKESSLGAPKTIFTPEAYTGRQLRNLLDNDGIYPSLSKDGLLVKESFGHQFLTDTNQAELIIDLQSNQNIGNLYIWNYNDEPQFGVSSYEIYLSDDGTNFINHTIDTMASASGSEEEPYTKAVEIEDQARFIKLVIKNDEAKIGLGKIYIEDTSNNPLFGVVTGTLSDPELTSTESSSRLWLQDGVVIGDKFYVYPILVKDIPGLFKVHSVNLIEVPIINNEINYDQATYYSTPLQFNTDDGGEVFFGAGIMNHIEHDGYVYIYGYKDLNGRYLTVGRFKPEHVKDFNEYEFFDGNTFVKDIRKVQPLIKDVSAELSVTYLETGEHQGKYMLVVMENTTSGRVSYSLSDTPYGPFSPYKQIFQTYEHTYLDAFTYNAKMQASISKPGRYIITYNVNSNNFASLRNSLIYYPRFIELIEVKRKENS